MNEFGVLELITDEADKEFSSGEPTPSLTPPTPASEAGSDLSNDKMAPMMGESAFQYLGEAGAMGKLWGGNSVRQFNPKLCFKKNQKNVVWCRGREVKSTEMKLWCT